MKHMPEMEIKSLDHDLTGSNGSTGLAASPATGAVARLR